MIELSKIGLSYRGELILSGSEPFGPAYEIRNKLPRGMIDLEYGISIKNGKLNNNEVVLYKILPEYSLIRLGTQIISWGLPQTLVLLSNSSGDLKFSHFLDQNSLKIVEDQRNNDILFYVEIICKYLATHGGPASIEDDFGVFKLSFKWKRSQAEWLRLLSSLGYSEKWVIELDRPKLEGFHEVLEHINKAGEDLFSKNRPDDALTDIRAAWNSLDPFLKQYEKDIKDKIDEGSIGEENKPSKSERVGEINNSLLSYLNSQNELLEKVKKFSQIGPHKEFYQSTYSDAILAYRLTVSLLSYYGEILSKLKPAEK
jgi:hypothetical protein